MKLNRLFPILTALSLVLLPACLKNNENYGDYTLWRQLNLNYIDSISIATVDGRLEYTPLQPGWDNSFTIFMKWHNSRMENQSLVTPFSTSTCHVKYVLRSIYGDTLDSSSDFTCVPNKMITGFMAAITNMCVNDSVTAVLPYTAGYGSYGSGKIPPYSTLIFDIKLDSISKLM